MTLAVVRRGLRRDAVLIFAGFFVFFACLRSRDYFDADGALRAIDVFHRPSLFLHAYNHLLYPVHIHYFHKLLGFFGVKAADPFQFFHLSQWLNHLCAAAALALFYVILRRVTGLRRGAWLGTALLAFSDCFFTSAVNPNEPMPGFAFSLLGIGMYLKGWETRRIRWAAGSALVMAYATATYFTMALASVPLVAAQGVLALRERAPDLRTFYLRYAVTYAALGALATFVIFTAAYVLVDGVRTLPALRDDFFSLPIKSGVWGTWATFTPLHAFMGFVTAFFRLHFDGFRALLRDPGALTRWAAASALTLLPLSLAAVALFQTRTSKLRTLPIALAFAAFCLLLALPVYWTFNYDKLWLQPTAAFILLVLLLFSRLEDRPSRTRTVFWGAWGFFTGTVLLWNLLFAALPSFQGRPRVVEFGTTMDRLIEEDALVFVQWDDIDTGMEAFFKARRQYVRVPDLAFAMSEAKLIERLDRFIRQAEEEDRAVYFLGLLETPREEWKASFLSRCGISYAAFEPYRKMFTPVVAYELRDGRRVLHSAARNPAEEHSPDGMIK